MNAVAKTAAFDPTMSQYESNYVDAGGIRTHYIEAGRGEPLILVHGGGPGADGYGNWHSCLPGFARNFHTICVDMLGFGNTEKPDPESFTYSQDARTRHMVSFIEALDIGKVTMIGNSMGGLTSMCTGIERPDLVRKLVLMGPAGIKNSGQAGAIAPLTAYDGTVAAMQKVIGVLTNKDYEMDEALLHYRVKRSNEPGTRNAQSAAMAWIKEQRGLYIEEDRIRKVSRPTLVVGGKNDPIVTPADIFRMLELIENSRGYLIPYCGHWVMMEYPEEFVDVCTRFIRH